MFRHFRLFGLVIFLIVLTVVGYLIFDQPGELLEPGWYSGVVWSTNEESVYFLHQEENIAGLYRLEAESGELELLDPNSRLRFDQGVTWGTDNSLWLTATEWSLFDGAIRPRSIITRFDPQTRLMEEVVSLSSLAGFSINPVTSELVYAERQDTTHDLFICEENLNNCSQITQTPNVSEVSPVWSPNGEYLAYFVSNGQNIHGRLG